jgi:hypothetical protein
LYPIDPRLSSPLLSSLPLPHHAIPHLLSLVGGAQKQTRKKPRRREKGNTIERTLLSFTILASHVLSSLSSSPTPYPSLIISCRGRTRANKKEVV